MVARVRITIVCPHMTLKGLWSNSPYRGLVSTTYFLCWYYFYYQVLIFYLTLMYFENVEIIKMKNIKTLLLCALTFANGFQTANLNLQIEDEKIYNQTVWNTRSVYEYFEGKQEEAKLNTFASMYFSHLKENFPYNTHGTCSYVAISMLLSFYDTYFNDFIIADDYETETKMQNDVIPKDIESPGIKSEPLEDVYGLSTYSYINYIENNYEEYLHLKLIKNAACLFGSYKFDAEKSARIICE